jgi:DNA modification methylase
MRTNAIYCGDAGNVLGDTTEFPDGCVDLLYADPPFFSNRTHEIFWGDGYELRSFQDRWKGGIENYISWMEPKLRECHRLLSPTGTLYLQCNHYANAYLRILLDRIFGDGHFRNEIIWCFSGGGIPKRDFPRKHGTIYRYTKGTSWTFNTEYRPYASGIVPTHSDGSPLDLARGTPITDWWSDLKVVTPFSAQRKEKVGWPTQKPLTLLQRIIRISSDPGQVVLDPFCGCGTTIVAAAGLGRKWVGIDVSPKACEVMAARMTGAGFPFRIDEILGMPKTPAQVRAMEPFEFQEWVVRQLGGIPSARRVGDMGIDGHQRDGAPIQVKKSERVGRNVVDNFKSAIQRDGRAAGTIVALSFGRGAYEEVARLRNLPEDRRVLIMLKPALDLAAPP